jgi:hypothetical protein
VVVGARTLSLLWTQCPHLVSALHATQVLHSRRLSVSRMRENFLGQLFFPLFELESAAQSEHLWPVRGVAPVKPDTSGKLNKT